MDSYRKYLPAAFVFAAIVLLYRTFFPVKETEFVLVTQFGRPLYAISGAGLHMKWAFQSATSFDRRLRIYNPRPSEFLTRDKKNIVVDSYVAWKIQDPNRFLQTVGEPVAAEMRLHDIVWSGLSAALGSHDLDSLVSASGSARTQDLMDQLAGLTDRAALGQYGINVVDVRIRRINLPEQNKQSVYARMRSEER